VNIPTNSNLIKISKLSLQIKTRIGLLYNNQDRFLRHVIINLIDQQLRIGNVNPIEFVRYLLCYMRDLI
jgi:hypothetical protein